MAILTDEIWSLMIAPPDTRRKRPASSAQIAQYEKECDIRLPQSYRDFLLRSNGGIFGGVDLFGLNGLRHSPQEVTQTAMGPVLAFGMTWAGDYYCFDIQERPSDGEYSVLLWQHQYSEDPEEFPELWLESSRHFVEFLLDVVT